MGEYGQVGENSGKMALHNTWFFPKFNSLKYFLIFHHKFSPKSTGTASIARSKKPQFRPHMETFKWAIYNTKSHMAFGP